MAFSEKIKNEVKKKAAFRCCRCQNIGIDIHHIIPEKDGGLDAIDNAAPLCQNCHDQFGDNPLKRKEIKQMRDWWYEVCEKKYAGEDLTVLNAINSKLENIEHGQEGIGELKEILKSISGQMIDSISATTASSTASAIVNSAAAVQLGPQVYSNLYCSNCNTRIGLLVGTDVCPNCKTRIN